MKFIGRFIRKAFLAAVLLTAFTASIAAQTGAAPKIIFHETDQVLPAGLWRWMLNGDVMTIERNTSASNNFSTKTTAISIASNGDVTIPQDFFVTGSATITVDTTVNGKITIDATDTEALLVRQDADAADVFTVNTTTPGVLIGGTANITSALTLTVPLAVPQGGMGAATYTDGGILLGSGTGIVSAMTRGTAGQMLIGSTSGDPIMGTLSGTANEVDVTTGDGTLQVGLPDDVTIAGDLTVSGTGPHVFGGISTNYTRNYFTGSFTSGGASTFAAKIWIDDTLTGASGDTTFLANMILAGNIVTQTASESIVDISTLRVLEPIITNNLTGTGVINEAASLHILTAPTEGVRNNALLVATGSSNFRGLVLVGTPGSDNNDEALPESLSVIDGSIEILDQATLGAETITDGAFPDTTNWAGATDWSDVISGNTTYTHSAGSGTLTQTSGQMAIAGKNNRWYKLTYTVSAVTATGALVLTLTNAFAAATVTLDVSSNATRSVVFQSNSAASSANFVLSATSDTASDTFTLDDLVLKEITGGNVIVAGKLTGGGANGMLVDGDGNVTLDVVLPVASGGSGAATFTDGGILLGSGTGAFTALAQATNGQIPIGSTSADPVLASITGTANEITVTDGAGSITLSIPDSSIFVTPRTTGAAEFNDAVLIGANGTTLDGLVHIVSSGTSTRAVVVEMPASASVAAQQWHYDGTEAANITVQATQTSFTLQARNFGNNVQGGVFSIQRNSSAGAEGGAAGALGLQEGDGSGTRWVWADLTGDLRINTSAPTGVSGSPTVSDLAGIEVGAQTSWHELKQDIKKFVDYQSSLDEIVNTPLYSYGFKNRHYESAYVIFEEDANGNSWFSYNDDLSMQQVPSLKLREIIGTHSGAIKALNERIIQLEKKVEELSSN